MARKVKVRIEMDAEAWAALADFARSRGMDTAEFVRKAFVTQKYLMEQEQRGAEIVLVLPDGEKQPVTTAA